MVSTNLKNRHLEFKILADQKSNMQLVPGKYYPVLMYYLN